MYSYIWLKTLWYFFEMYQRPDKTKLMRISHQSFLAPNPKHLIWLNSACESCDDRRIVNIRDLWTPNHRKHSSSNDTMSKVARSCSTSRKKTYISSEAAAFSGRGTPTKPLTYKSDRYNSQVRELLFDVNWQYSNEPVSTKF